MKIAVSFTAEYHSNNNFLVNTFDYYMDMGYFYFDSANESKDHELHSNRARKVCTKYI